MIEALIKVNNNAGMIFERMTDRIADWRQLILKGILYID